MGLFRATVPIKYVIKSFFFLQGAVPSWEEKLKRTIKRSHGMEDKAETHRLYNY
jgi:hypothetical protein